MKAWEKSSTDSYFDDIDFHDALVERIEVKEWEIIVELESVNILPGHPLNPYDVAKNTDRCRLIFRQVISNEAVIYSPEENIPQPIQCSDFKSLEILKFERFQSGESQLFKIFGADDQFCEWEVRAEGFVLQWNEFREDAWFVGWTKDK
ncbi:hypothetical protein [Paenibacillus sp. UNC499MF]|uniref:hypothetical protein n=1 Tax=Paenibacillus sp. UNC499MF TaxID=1502751 RepID=UPI00089FDBED|nr:hypothetical protein [Paenibacillus sp. UNC499MF]SEG75668.1 hypothetical protein SAMN02799616_04844 [Paenibacillus sp. UNC499MF]